MENGREVLVCVGGGISAYKSAELVRLLVKDGASVRVAMTDAARAFVQPLTFQALTGHKVATSLLDAAEEAEIGHIRLADRAEVVVVAPATADLIGRIAAGLANDVPTAVLLATRAPVLLAPAMNVQMWRHPTVQENLARLRSRPDVHVVGPGVGDLACGWVGEGRMAEPAEIAHAARDLLRRDLGGRRIVVTAGPTLEDLDPVRFLGNRSTGRMGHALARVARRRGASVTLVTGPTSLDPPAGVEVVPVRGALEMRDALRTAITGADALLMAAAVSDYRPAAPSAAKLKRGAGGRMLPLVANPDLLAEIGAARRGRIPVLVGFAVETEDLVARAREKRKAKKVDVMVGNLAHDGFGGDDDDAVIVEGTGVTETGRVSKDALAGLVLDRVQRRLGTPAPAASPAASRGAAQPRQRARRSRRR